MLSLVLNAAAVPRERLSKQMVNRCQLPERLFVVGITRAKSRLFISLAKYRTIRGQLLRTIPSQFLYELGIDITDSDSENEHDDDELDSNQYDFMDCEAEHFSRGQLVRHPQFGLGKIQKFVDMGANSIAEIKFNTGQIKTLMLKYAKLEKIE